MKIISVQFAFIVIAATIKSNYSLNITGKVRGSYDPKDLMLFTASVTFKNSHISVATFITQQKAISAGQPFQRFFYDNRIPDFMDYRLMSKCHTLNRSGKENFIIQIESISEVDDLVRLGSINDIAIITILDPIPMYEMMTVKLTQKTFEDLKSIQAQLISYSHLNYINSLTLAKQNVHPRVVKVSCSHNEFFFFAAFTTANTAEYNAGSILTCDDEIIGIQSPAPTDSPDTAYYIILDQSDTSAILSFLCMQRWSYPMLNAPRNVARGDWDQYYE